MTQPALGSVSIVNIGGSQQAIYHPGPGAFTGDSFTYRVTDSLGGTATATGTIKYIGVGTVSSSLNPGATDLVIVGISGSHSVTLATSGPTKKVKVTVDGSTIGSYTVTGRVFGFAQDGTDTFNGSSTSASLWFYGGTGNNTFIGGSGGDVFIGGTGNDNLNGRTGRNMLIGGRGTNILTGSKGSDVLIAGSTIYDAPTFANQATLLQALTAWQISKKTPNLPAAVSAAFARPTSVLESSAVTGSDLEDVLIGNTKSPYFGDFAFNGGNDTFNGGRYIKPNQSPTA